MAGKPRKVVDLGDPRTFSQSGAFETIVAMAEANSWTSGFAVAMTAAHFGPKMPNTITAAEIEKAKAEIVARGLAQKGQKVAEAKKEAFGGRERFPFKEEPGEAQELWDSGRWRDLASGVYLTFSGLRKRFAAEITAGQTISRAQVDVYQKELEAEKTKVDALVNEQPDPDPLVVGVRMPCVASRHYGRNDPEEATQRHPIRRGDDGELHRKRHGKNDDGDEITAGSFLKLDEFEGELPPGVIKVEEAGKVLFGKYYCAKCRAAALEDFWARKELPANDPNRIDRDAVLTFYTVNALRIIAKRESESASKIGQARDEEGGSSRRVYVGGQYGTHKGRQDWRTTRRGVSAGR